MLAIVANTSKLREKKKKEKTKKKSGRMEVGHMANGNDHKTKKGEQIIGTQLWMGLWALLENKHYTPTTSTSGS
jgi:hypothetical protein